MKLMGLKVAILACDGFEDSEMTLPRKALEKEGATVHLIAPSAKSIKSWLKGEWHKSYPVDIKLEKAKASHYDLILLPGGVMNPDHLRTIKSAVRFVDHFFKKDKPVAAICHGPLTLIETNRLRDMKMTSYPSIKSDLINAGADWVNRKVVVDGKLITSRKPQDIPSFNKAIIKLALKEKELKEKSFMTAKMKKKAKKPFIE